MEIREIYVWRLTIYTCSHSYVHTSNGYFIHTHIINFLRKINGAATIWPKFNHLICKISMTLANGPHFWYIQSINRFDWNTHILCELIVRESHYFQHFFVILLHVELFVRVIYEWRKTHTYVWWNAIANRMHWMQLTTWATWSEQLNKIVRICKFHPLWQLV